MAEQGTEPGGSHRLSAAAALKRNEQVGRVGHGTFQVEVGFQGLDRILRERQKALLVAFAMNPELLFSQPKIGPLNGQDFVRAEAIEEHQGNESEIAISAEASPKPGYFIGRKRNHQMARPLDGDAGGGAPRDAVTERAAPRRGISRPTWKRYKQRSQLKR